MANTRKLTVEIAGDTRGLSSAVNDASSSLSSFGRSAGPALAGVAAGFGVLAAAGIGLVQAAYNLGASFDSAYDTIAIGTGATGAELDGLKDTFRDVFSEVPAGMDDVAGAITGLNARLGLTGDALADASTTLLDFTRITGSDTTEAVNLLTRAMGDWGIASSDIAGVMDKLFVAQQETGVGWEVLAQQVVQFGAPLRQLGYDFDTTIALLAKFNAEGVNTELVMGSMRIALGKLSKSTDDEAKSVRRSGVDRKAQARAVADARRAIEDAAEGVVEANKRVIESEKELNELLMGPSADDLEDAKLSQAEAALALEKAQARAVETQKELDEAVASGDPDAVAEAKRDVRDAELALARAQRASKKSTEELNKVTNWSADTDEKVIDARERVADAQKGVADAEDRATRAQERLTDAQTRSVGASSGAEASSNLLEKTIKRLGLESAPTEEKFAGLVEEIKTMKDPADAAALAIELFGARAGPDMVAAIREGRFDGLNPLVADLQSAQGTVEATAAGTEDFSERFQVAMNNLKIALEPIVTKIFTWFGEDLAPVIERVAAALDERGVGGAVSELRKIFEENWPEIKRVINETLQDVLEWMIDHTDEFFKAGLKIGEEIAKGIQQGMVEGVVKNIPGGKQLMEGISREGNFFKDYKPPTKHAGGTFRAPTPGGEGFALLQDGEKVSRPAHGGGGGQTIILQLNGREVARALTEDQRAGGEPVYVKLAAR